MGVAGRIRNAKIDERVLKTAAQHLSEFGYDSMSISAVAEQAGTTRQALYRRWPTKADLAAAVVNQLADKSKTQASESPFTDLVAELTAFQRDISLHGRLSLVGTMLQETTDSDVRSRYQATVIAPRRKRLRAILQRGVMQGLLDVDADIDVALTMCTGSWYGRALAGVPVQRNWPYRSAALVWRSLGGQPVAR